jgi:hypothetical protein
MTTATPDFIDATFRVVATTELRPSPNRRRAAIRIVLWNFAFIAAVVALPILF